MSPRRLALALLAVLLLSGASSAGPPSGGTLTVGISNDVTSFLDWTVNSVSELEVIDLVFRQLAYYDRTTGEFVPGLARSWAFEKGGTALVFTLQKDARWEDGKPVTPEDVVFTWRMQTDPTVGWFGRDDKSQITTVEPAGPGRVRFVFRTAYPAALFDAVSGHVYPAHALASWTPAGVKKRAAAWAPVGCGPFRVGRREPGQGLELLASETYFGARPKLARVVFRVADKESRGLMFEKGELDVLRGASAEHFTRFTADGKHNGYATRTQYVVLGWNCRTAPFDDVRVRRALALAIDRERLVALAARGRGAPAYGPVPPVSWAAKTWPAARPDLAQARRLLDEAGWKAGADGVRTKDGKPLAFELKLSNAQFFLDTAELLRAAWEPLGVRVTARPIEGKLLNSELHAGKGDAWLYQERPNDKVDLTDLAHSATAAPAGLNFAGYRSAAFDALCEKARAAKDRKDAQRLWREAQDLLAADQPYTFLIWRDNLDLVSTKFDHVRIDENGLFFHVDEWRAAEGRPTPAP